MMMELDEREKMVQEKEYRATARERLAKAGLPTEAADLLQCWSGDAFEKSWTKLMDVLGPQFEGAVIREVDKRFKSGGHIPAQSAQSGPDRVKQATSDAFKKKG